MKNLHYLKKFVVMVLAAMMTLSTFAMPTFAAENKVATIKGVEGSATVVGYQFVEQNSTDYKWKPLDWVGGTQLADDSGFKFTHGNQEYTYYYESTDYGSGAKDNKPALEALANKARTTTPPAASGTTGHQSCPVCGSLGVVVVVAGAVVVVVERDSRLFDDISRSDGDAANVLVDRR